MIRCLATMLFLTIMASWPGDAQTTSHPPPGSEVRIRVAGNAEFWTYGRLIRWGGDTVKIAIHGMPFSYLQRDIQSFETRPPRRVREPAAKGAVVGGGLAWLVTGGSAKRPTITGYAALGGLIGAAWGRGARVRAAGGRGLLIGAAAGALVLAARPSACETGATREGCAVEGAAAGGAAGLIVGTIVGMLLPRWTSVPMESNSPDPFGARSGRRWRVVLRLQETGTFHDRAGALGVRYRY